MSISRRNRAIFVELEATAGTAETLVNVDVVQVQDLQVNVAESLRMNEREIIRSSLNPEKAVYGGAKIGFQFTVELKGSGAAGTAPRIGDLLQACSCSETVVASTSVTYAPQSDLTLHKTVTIGYMEGGNYRIAKGCRGTFSIDATSGQYAKVTFNLRGRIHSESVAAAPTPSFETTVPPAFVGATFVVGAYAAVIEKLTMDIANNIVDGTNPNNSDGFGALTTITGRATRGTINPEVELISAKDFVGIFRAGTDQAIGTGVIGGTAGNRWALSIPNAYFRNVGDGNRDELLTYEIEYGARDTNGTDDFSLAFT